jgi:hypothetical protein
MNSKLGNSIIGCMCYKYDLLEYFGDNRAHNYPPSHFTLKQKGISFVERKQPNPHYSSKASDALHIFADTRALRAHYYR